MEISIKLAKNLKPHPDDSNLPFGSIFTDHMFIMNYSPEKYWHNPRIEPYSSIMMDPAAMVLHYGQAVFEGLKAFRTKSDTIVLFRAKENFKRMNKSAKSLCIPEFDESFLLSALKKLLSIEKDWIPKSHGTSLYIRPTIIGTDPYLGVRASYTYQLFIILSPVGAYYSEGFNPVKIWVTKDYVRTVRGGLGEAKTPANYAASLYAGEEAHKSGYTQVLWLDGIMQNYIEEVGSMNIFFVIDGELITPELTGSILPGITRDSVIALAKLWKIPVAERRISIDEVIDAHNSNKLQEVFGSGTAAVISPVEEIKYNDKILKIGDGKVGPMANKFFKSIIDLQYGNTKEDPFGWIETVDV